MSNPHKKGSFGRAAQRSDRRADLPLSKRYLVPGTRRSMLLGGLGLGLVALLLVWLDVEHHGGDWLAGGPLSSAHATLDMGCASCHGEAFGTVLAGVADTGCSECHERAEGAPDQVPPALFSVESHAVLRTAAESTPRALDLEPSCASCHGEHQGRDASLVNVADRQCLACHQDHDFDRDHPDFAFTEALVADDDALHFAHGRHVKEVLKRTGWDDTERTCLTCHQPTDDVRGFEAVDFDRHCADCHLGTGVATTRLPLDDGERAVEDGPGVWSLERIRRSQLPGTDWSFTAAPTDFRGSPRRGRRVVKLRLDHEDPWILFNLRRLRQLRYGDAGVADLLDAAPTDSSQTADERATYEEAVATLEAQAEALRGSSDPAVQSDLAWIEDELTRIRRELGQGSTELASIRLPDGSSSTTPARPQEWVDAWDELVTDLSAQCSNCHRMARATILEIDDDQRVLTRAEFDHGSHLTGSPATERSCLDCHGRLPIEEAVAATDADVLKALESRDRAAMHNLPGIATCRECHGSGKVASACVDCHSFHPDAASRRAQQLVHFGEADLREGGS